MNRFIHFALFLGLAILTAGQGFAGDAGQINWRHDYSTALAESQQSGKLLIICVSTTWCGPCRMLKQNTLTDPRLAGLVESQCIALALDGDQNQRLVQQLGVTSYPTQIFASPEGRIVGRLEGFTGVAEYSSAVTRAIEIARQTDKITEPAKSVASQTARNSNARPAADRQAKPQREAAEYAIPVVKSTEQPKTPDPLALDGFCLVAMIERAELTPGKPANTIAYHGVRLQFESAEAMARFQRNPSKYLPAENGHCVVSWAESKQWVPGKVKLPAIYEDHIYFFATESVRSKFLRDPERYVDRSGKAIR